MPASIRNGRCVAILRSGSTELVATVVSALLGSGLTAMEVTLSSDSALSVVEQLSREIPSTASLGVGTVTHASEVRQALEAGAQFIVTPTMSADIVEAALNCRMPVIMGALSPTEAFAAWSSGASAVKLFPGSLGGPGYVRDLLQPFPEMMVIPTGGVTIEDASDYIAAGAVAVGVGGALIGSALTSEADLPQLVARAGLLRASLGVAAPATVHLV